MATRLRMRLLWTSAAVLSCAISLTDARDACTPHAWDTSMKPMQERNIVGDLFAFQEHLHEQLGARELSRFFGPPSRIGRKGALRSRRGSMVNGQSTIAMIVTVESTRNTPSRMQ